MIETIQGNLLDAFDRGDVDIIIHQVNMKATMGAGIAKQIAERYPEHLADYLNECPRANIGSTIVTKLPRLDGSGRKYIIGVFSQCDCGLGENDEVVRHTNYYALANGIETALLEHSFGNYYDLPNDNPIIAMPHKIGSALGGGDWSVTETILNDMADIVTGRLTRLRNPVMVEFKFYEYTPPPVKMEKQTVGLF
jgi:hypothetical protein